MKTTRFLPIFLIMAMLLIGCEMNLKEIGSLLSGNVEKEKAYTEYNIVLVVDGTDIVHQQYAVPLIDVEYVLTLAEKIQQNGCGKFWLLYVDSNVENNPIAYLEIPLGKFSTIKKEKRRSETKTQYSQRLQRETEAFRKDSLEYVQRKTERVSTFRKEAEKILEAAHSKEVITAKVGSDVHGAINAGNRLLKSVRAHPFANKYLVLVSDGVDNVKKPLNDISSDIHLLLINNSGSASKLEKVEELDNLSRMEEYIFTSERNINH